MEEFCRRTSQFHATRLPANPSAVTQIPLDSPRPDGTQAGRPRPPWIRPIRKKTLRSGGSNESTSQHSSPEGFSPSDAFLDLSSASAKMGSPAPAPFANGKGGYAGTPVQAFMDANAMDIGGDAAMSMNPSDLLAMFSVPDGSGLDVAQLLMSPAGDTQSLADATSPTSFFSLGPGPSGGVLSPAP